MMLVDSVFFEKYTSNTLASTSNQSFFYSDGSVKKGRVYYKIFAGGCYNYSLMFSGTIDSTYSDGSHSVCGTVCKRWTVHGVRVGRTKECNVGEATEPYEFISLRFDGKEGVDVDGGMVCSDAFVFEADKGDYMCVEIEYSGEMIPYHEEIIVDTYDFTGGKWVSSSRTPVPNFVGCDRKVEKRIAYLGDSITQGIGTQKNAYSHWNALLSEKLGEGNAYWNIGIGFARSTDAAADKSWLYKAKQNDVVFVCLGVNDIFRVASTEKICLSLEKIVRTLKETGARVVLQSVPPFDYDGEFLEKWLYINGFIEEKLKKLADVYFDCVPVLSVGNESKQRAKYGGHPNECGCKVWAEALYERIKDFIGGLEK